MPRYLIEMRERSLDVTVAEDADLDDRFVATCNDTGERIRVSGWLMDSCELVEDETAGAAVDVQTPNLVS